MQRRIYLLNPKDLPPETIAVTFAKTSRSPQTFEEIAAELSDEKSAQFHEKWVVGYGHASVAEHAVLHIALENVSRLAIESIESNRLASYTEKSTRYQKWTPGAYLIPPELESSPLKAVYTAACDLLFDTYEKTLPLVRAAVEKYYPCEPGESDAAWDRRIRSRYVDVCRFLLPAASLANVGLTANARVLEHAIMKMLSSSLEEVRAIGSELKVAARAEVPTLVKYAEPNAYLRDQAGLYARSSEHDRNMGDVLTDWCRLVQHDAQGQERVLAAAAYQAGSMDFQSVFDFILQASVEEKSDMANRLLAGRGEHDPAPRALEETAYSFDVLVDQGGYFELKRHRMMTQLPQVLTADHGFVTPRLMVEAGADGLYQAAMQQASRAYDSLVEEFPFAASYVIPNGYLRRVLLTFNLRSAFHLCALRSAENAHFSMRRLALRIAEEIRRVHPILGEYLHTTGVDWHEVQDQHFAG